MGAFELVDQRGQVLASAGEAAELPAPLRQPTLTEVEAAQDRALRVITGGHPFVLILFAEDEARLITGGIEDAGLPGALIELGEYLQEAA